ncbi:MAG: DUF975 family protein [Caulobacteraceae bacterium]
MWTRKELKDRAKNVLRKIYWKAFLVSLVIAFAGGNGGGGGGGGRSNRLSNGNVSPDGILSNLAIIISVVSVFILVAIALRIFLGYPLEVGGRKYFIQSARHEDNKRCFRFAFNGENYMGIVLAMLLKGVQNFLWYLLLIIPGIVKSYAYSMVPYILAENPNIGSREAIKESIEMTDGHKFDMFVLDLSFLGWFLLGALFFGVGVFFVLPYVDATKAELYLVLRNNRVDSSMLIEE